VFDLLVLIAASAATMGLYGWCYPPLEAWPIWRMRLSSYSEVVVFSTAMIYFGWPVLVACTPALAAIRLHGARPRMVRLMCQPGTVGCFTALGFLATTGLVSWPVRDAVFLTIPALPAHLSRADRSELTMAICRSNTGVGYAVLAAWLILAFGGRWRPERGWIDLLAWLLGVGWVVWSAAYTICPHL
jgi:hypothetical protein